MSANSKKPELRFDGFDDAWEQRELGEVCEIYDGTHQTPKYRNNGVMFLSVENIMTLTSEKYISFEDFKRDFHVAPENGDVLMTRIGDIGTANVVETCQPIAYYVSLALLKNKMFVPYFLKESIFSKRVQRELWHRTLHIAFPKKINKNEIAKVCITYPKESEQEKIGAFFRGLDHLITLHQRKYEKLIEVKKSMLEKMFPHDGADVPEIRFAGFTDAWEQRKLGDLAQFSKGSGYSKSDIKNNGTPIILYGRLYTQYETVISDVDTFVDEKDGSVYSRGGEVVVPASGETAEDISIASVVAKSGILLGGDLNIITPQNIIDPTFLAISISNGKPHQDMAKMAQGKSVVHLHNTDLEKINLLYPKLAEQQQISRYFCQIDHLITLHQRKLEKLKNIKKSCLKKMFV